MFSDNNENFDAKVLSMSEEEFDINKFLDGDDSSEVGLSENVLEEAEVSDVAIDDGFSTETDTFDVNLEEDVLFDIGAQEQSENVFTEGTEENITLRDSDKESNISENIEVEFDDVSALNDAKEDGSAEVFEQTGFAEYNEAPEEYVGETVGENMGESLVDDENPVEESDVAAEYVDIDDDSADVLNDAVYSATEECDEEGLGFVKWYSGNSSDHAFEIDKNSISQEISGNEECQVIHINVGLSSYGWRIHFDNGVVMGIDDVREYQLRNGNLPSSNGAIIYSENQIEFTNINKITIYRSVRYFTYG